MTVRIGCSPPAERWASGLCRLLGEQVCRKASSVRIRAFPPSLRTCGSEGNWHTCLVQSQALGSSKLPCRTRFMLRVEYDDGKPKEHAAGRVPQAVPKGRARGFYVVMSDG